MLKNNGLRVLILLLSLIAYMGLGYYIQREQAGWLLTLFSLTFIGYLLFIWKTEKLNLSLKWIFISGLVFRIVLLFVSPNLSDDNYRFIWDGRILADGGNPYVVYPEDYVKTQKASDLKLTGEVYDEMNSKTYYTVYPPVNQFFFGLTAYISGDNIHLNNILLRVVIIFFELGLCYFLLLLLGAFHLKDSLLTLYWLNPLVIIELTGNLHFEGVMLFFLVAAIYYLQVRNRGVSAVFYALSIGTKLIPLMFLPFLIKRLRWKTSVIYFLTIGGVLLAMFLPFLNKELIQNLSSSIELYFQKFEFNASIYYVIRWIGEQITGYNIIQIAGKTLWVIVFFSIVAIAITEKERDFKSLFKVMLLSLTIYLAMATTIHPWYIIPLILFTTISGFAYPVLWSLVGVLSYLSYKMSGSVEENTIILFIEYLSIFTLLILELIKKLKVKFQ